MGALVPGGTRIFIDEGLRGALGCELQNCRGEIDYII